MRVCERAYDAIGFAGAVLFIVVPIAVGRIIGKPVGLFVGRGVSR